jgi:hypothetical protein
LDGIVKINFTDLNVYGRIQRPFFIENRRNSFAGSATTEGLKNKDKEIDDLLASASNLKLKSVANDPANSQISSTFYSTKTHPPTHKDDDDNDSISPFAWDMNGPFPPPPPQQIPHQLRVLHDDSKNFFSQIDWPTLQKDFSSKENKDLRHAYRARFSERERDLIKVQWTEKMIESQKHILFFYFLQKYFPSGNTLNVVKKKFVKEDKTVVKSSHPPLESILIDCNGFSVKGSPFKSPDDSQEETRKIIEQNNFVNQSLHTIGQQLDCIEEKFSPSVLKEEPLISLPESRKSLGLKPKSQKTIEKIEQILYDLKINQASSSKTVAPISQQFFDFDSTSSHNSTDNDIRVLKKDFEKIDLDLKLQRIYDKSKIVNFSKNWYSRPTPPDLQFEERFLQSQFSVSSDKIYEWNIDGLSEHELLNKMNHMSMVANVYDTNQNLSQAEIVDLLATGFSGTLRNWWDKHLTEETREGIRKAIKKGDDGFPIFNEKIGMEEPDSVNTLIFTIVKHFVGTPSNITTRISNYLNNLRCPTMFDYRWYQDVFHSRVMLRLDSQKPYWKEKFINGLPSLFAHKVKGELINSATGMIDYENLTYGDLFSTVKKLGIKMCIDQKMIRQQMKNTKKAKYEMGNLCEQFGLPPIAPFGLIGISLINFPERHMLHIIILIRKENLISLQLQIIFLKNLGNLRRRRRILSLKNIFLKENVSTVKNQDILLINALILPKRLNKKLML